MCVVRAYNFVHCFGPLCVRNGQAEGGRRCECRMHDVDQALVCLRAPPERGFGKQRSGACVAALHLSPILTNIIIVSGLLRSETADIARALAPRCAAVQLVVRNDPNESGRCENERGPRRPHTATISAMREISERR